MRHKLVISYKNISNCNKWFSLYTFLFKRPASTFSIIIIKIGDFRTKELDKWEYPLIAISDDIDNHLVDNYNKITEPPKLQTHPTELALY